MEVTVSGKRVWLRDRLTAREGWPLRHILAREASGERLTFDEECQALAALVEAWEFPGDPADPASYDNLDMADAVAIEQAVSRHLPTLFATPKN